MKAKLIWTLLILGLFHSSSLTVVAEENRISENVDEVCVELKDALGNLILRFLEKLKAHMSDGIPSLNIPPLDPLQLPDNSFRVSKPNQYDISGIMRNSKLEGLKEFNVTHISTSIMHLQVNVSLEIPFIFMTGSYNLKGKLIRFIPISGQGPYIMKPIHVTTSITSHMQIKQGHLLMKDMNFNLDMRDIFIKFEGLFGGGSFGNLVNSVINRFAVRLFHRVEPEIHDKLRVAILTEINDLLKDMPLSDLIGALKPPCRMAVERELFNRTDNY